MRIGIGNLRESIGSQAIIGCADKDTARDLIDIAMTEGIKPGCMISQGRISYSVELTPYTEEIHKKIMKYLHNHKRIAVQGATHVIGDVIPCKVIKDE